MRKAPGRRLTLSRETLASLTAINGGSAVPRSQVSICFADTSLAACADKRTVPRPLCYYDMN